MVLSFVFVNQQEMLNTSVVIFASLGIVSTTKPIYRSAGKIHSSAEGRDILSGAGLECTLGYMQVLIWV